MPWRGSTKRFLNKKATTMNLTKQTYLSGIKELQVADAATATLEDIISCELTGFTISDVTVIPFTRDTGSFSSDISQKAIGIISEKSASIFFPGISIEVINKLDELVGRQLIVGILTREDQFWVLGTPDQPLKLSANYGSGKSLSDKSGFQIDFDGQGRISPALSSSTFDDVILYSSTQSFSHDVNDISHSITRSQFIAVGFDGIHLYTLGWNFVSELQIGDDKYRHVIRPEYVEEIGTDLLVFIAGTILPADDQHLFSLSIDNENVITENDFVLHGQNRQKATGGVVDNRGGTGEYYLRLISTPGMRLYSVNLIDGVDYGRLTLEQSEVSNQEQLIDRVTSTEFSSLNHAYIFYSATAFDGNNVIYSWYFDTDNHLARLDNTINASTAVKALAHTSDKQMVLLLSSQVQLCDIADDGSLTLNTTIDIDLDLDPNIYIYEESGKIYLIGTINNDVVIYQVANNTLTLIKQVTLKSFQKLRLVNSQLMAIDSVNDQVHVYTFNL